MTQKIITVEQMKKLDRMAIEDRGLPAMFLMEKAGLAVATEVAKAFVGIKKPYVCFVCGSGNNGGDGFVTARHLFNVGINVKIFFLGKEEDLKDDTRSNYDGLVRMKCPIEKVDHLSSEEISKADVVVDAIFGIGLNREIQGPFKSAIEVINNNAKKVIAVDIPSGLNGTTGEIFGVCVKATTTVTFHLPKKGFYEGVGPQYVGNIVVADIGIPADLEV